MSFDLVPSRFSILIILTQINEFIKATAATSMVLSVFLFYMKCNIEQINSALAVVTSLNLFVRMNFIILPAFISLTIKRKIVLFIIKIVSAIGVLAGLYGLLTNIPILNLPLTPNTALVKAFLYLLNIFNTGTRAAALEVAGALLFYSLLAFVVILMIGTKNIDVSKIYEAKIYISIIKKKINENYAMFCAFYSFLPSKLKLLTAKEMLQFFSEYSNMAVIIFNAGMLVAVLFIAQNVIPNDVVLVSLTSLMGYISFFIALTAIARDKKYSWILHAHYPQWHIVSISKFISGYFCSLLLCAIIATLFFGVLLIVTKQIYNNYLYLFVWNLFTTIPAAMGLGFIVSCFINVKEKNADEKVVYSFSGFESVFYILVMILISAPSISAALSGKVMYMAAFVAFEGILLGIGLLSVSKKIHEF
jgi:hypothetical protein